LFRLTWNRKRSTGLVFLELFGCFVVLCAVATGAAYTIDNWRRPLGFEWNRRWHITVDFGEFLQSNEDQRRAVVTNVQRILDEVGSRPDVEAVVLMENVPYYGSTSSWTFQMHGRKVDVQIAAASPQLREALGMKLASGRWIEASEATPQWTPAVISKNLARAYFGAGDPLGQPLVANPQRGLEPGEAGLRVVGVLNDYRREGETRPAPYTVFVPAKLDPAKPEFPPAELIVLARPGVGARFEEDLVRQIQRLAPTWSFNVRTLEQARSRWLRSHLMPLAIAATIGAFLLLMVGFGLVGVLWQNVARRTAEIGLRRALGATAANVRMQIIGELLAVATIAMAAGTVLFLQLPLLGTFGFLSWRVYVYGLVAAVAVLYCLVVACGLYPGWMATRVHPARALQHE
jgi:putative ABC transport system permease protein